MSIAAWPYRYFYDYKYDRILEVKQNACGCHPCDLLVVWGRGYYQSASYSFKDDVELETFLERYEELK